MKSEHDLQNEIRLELTKLGFTVFRVNVGSVKLADGRWFDTGLPKGFSDLMAIRNGNVYFIEVKTSIGRATQDQLRFIENMRNKGCIAGVVRSMEDVLDLILIGNK